jgi:hypothetical protein
MAGGKERRIVAIVEGLMARLLVWLLIIAVFVGGLVWLSGKDATVPQKRVEKVIPANALPQ